MGLHLTQNFAHMKRDMQKITDVLNQKSDDEADPKGRGSVPRQRVRKPLPGENLRVIRQARGLSLINAARLCAVSPATLSRIENGLMSPTFDVMTRISEGLGIAVYDLIREQPDAAEKNLRGWSSRTRLGTGRQIETAQYRFEFLCDDVLAKTFTLLRAEVLCRTLDEFGPFQSHTGQEQITVQDGTVEVHLQHYKPRLLHCGDSLAFDSTLAHAVIAPDAIATVFWVFVPEARP
ncbi:XRE family transcriptional regulator [Granulosicoccaceae sp. 1_MG-2023]|nr:XRE family transcriptional regulator [Granulosicoccaceae sp. 1_MG-2023]